MDFPKKDVYAMDDLLQIMAILRGDDGCPWDREQTHQSIRRNFLEEAYEVAEAIDEEDPVSLKEELGDVLMQVVFHAQIEQEQGGFAFSDVVDGVCKKLIDRHPHVFGNVTAETSQEVLQNWDAIKKQEKGQETFTDSVRAVPKALPALLRSEKVQSRAAKSGFDYPDVDYAFNDFESELFDLRRAMNRGDRQGVNKELGDLMFNCVNVARFLDIDPEQSLNDSTDEFVRRFGRVEEIAAERGIDLKNCSMKKHNALWKQAKQD